MSQSIQVSFVQEGDVYTVHTGSSVLKDIVMDYTGGPGNGAGRQLVHPAHRGGPELFLRKHPGGARGEGGPFPRYPGAGNRNQGTQCGRRDAPCGH